mgnify:CR=1 FL=1|tara:strand:+ start:510 stop:1673 length:1164 start_codon:yes stop_codon:yes gene_type:complete
MQVYYNINANFSRLKAKGLKGRYITNAHIEPLLKQLPKEFFYKIIGRSELGKPIYAVKVGKGLKKVLIWSQMHGNESTSTKALFDFLISIDTMGFKDCLDYCQLLVIPILNPDGATSYTRGNANGIDLNRDAQARSQLESRVLRDTFDDFNPDFCFNMHDQRSIYGVGNTKLSAVMSFLAPAQDSDCNVTVNRKMAMGLIQHINSVLQLFIPNQVARFNDTFNFNCVGDCFQSLGVPTLLFEAGHYKDDYSREESRKYTLLALLSALDGIKSNLEIVSSTTAYFNIPENTSNFFDVLIRNTRISDDKSKTIDIGICYNEVLVANQIKFNAVVKSIGDLKHFSGHQIIDADNKLLELAENQNLELGSAIGEFFIKNKKITLLDKNNSA